MAPFHPHVAPTLWQIVYIYGMVLLTYIGLV